MGWKGEGAKHNIANGESVTGTIDSRQGRGDGMGHPCGSDAWKTGSRGHLRWCGARGDAGETER